MTREREEPRPSRCSERARGVRLRASAASARVSRPRLEHCTMQTVGGGFAKSAGVTCEPRSAGLSNVSFAFACLVLAIELRRNGQCLFSVLIDCLILMRARKNRPFRREWRAGGERGTRTDAHVCLRACVSCCVNAGRVLASGASRQANIDIYVFLRFSVGSAEAPYPSVVSLRGGGRRRAVSVFAFSFRALLLCCSGATSGGRLPAVEGEGFFSCSLAESGTSPFSKSWERHCR
jgi:hypothetical protein